MGRNRHKSFEENGSEDEKNSGKGKGQNVLMSMSLLAKRVDRERDKSHDNNRKNFVGLFSKNAFDSRKEHDYKRRS